MIETVSSQQSTITTRPRRRGRRRENRPSFFYVLPAFAPLFVLQYLAKHPQVQVPIEQAEVALPFFNDPTGGLIYNALSKIVDEVGIEDVPAKRALDQAEATAQSALTQYLEGDR